MRGRFNALTKAKNLQQDWGLVFATMMVVVVVLMVAVMMPGGQQKHHPLLLAQSLPVLALPRHRQV